MESENKANIDTQWAERQGKCWREMCFKKARLEAWTGWHFCLKHFIEDYKWGSGRHFWIALKYTKIITS